MAYTKVFAIRKRLDKSIQYVQNSEKTELAAMIQYAKNEEKETLVSALNCQIETAYNEMQSTKERWKKTDGVQGYHLIQSFAPGEVNPKEAHQIGVELANILFGEHYEVLIGTHLDQWHLHNHIVVNSVSFTTGEKYHSNRKRYYGEIRKVSDELCKNHALSIINPQKHGKHYAEYQAEKEQKPTIRSMIRMDIDSVIDDAYSFQSFLSLLEKRGYIVNQNPKRKYITVKPPGAKRALRLASLGDGYTEEAIQNRIRENRFGNFEKKAKKKYYAKHQLPHNRKKLHGFQALYFRYVYFLQGNKTKVHKKYLSYDIRKEVIRLERYQKQFLFLLKTDIKTEEELNHEIAILEKEIHQLSKERDQLYKLRKQANEMKKTIYDETIDTYTSVLRQKRKALYLAIQIKDDALEISRIFEQTDSERKGERISEYKWRNR